MDDSEATVSEAPDTDAIIRVEVGSGEFTLTRPSGRWILTGPKPTPDAERPEGLDELRTALRVTGIRLSLGEAAASGRWSPTGDGRLATTAIDVVFTPSAEA